jgi:hypothetical protein
MITRKELIDKWAENLRSGKYAQGTGSLADGPKDDGKYCCLGVLCETAIELGAPVQRITYDNLGRNWLNGYDRTNGLLDTRIIKKINEILTEPLPLPDEILNEDGEEFSLKVKDDESVVDLAEANDAGQSFDVIANMIQKQADLSWLEKSIKGEAI